MKNLTHLLRGGGYLRGRQPALPGDRFVHDAFAGSLVLLVFALLGSCDRPTAPRPDYTLIVEVAGYGKGTVTSQPAGIDCSAGSGTCSLTLPQGSQVTLTGTPDARSEFGGWSHGCSGNGACAVTLTSNQTVGAAFDRLHRELRIARDTALSGTIEVTRFEIAAGATVTVLDGLRLVSAGDVVIPGDLVGDCVPIELRAGGDLRISGSVSNLCSDEMADGAPMRLLADGAIRLDGDGEITASHDLEISNDPGAGVRAASRLVPSAAFSGVNAAEEPVTDCDIEKIVGVWEAPRGHDGSPRGRDGKDGGSLTISCRDFLTITASLFAGNGGDGGRGISTATDAGIGGDGGRGGDLLISARSGISLDHGNHQFTVLWSGAGGAGGEGRGNDCVGTAKAEALGGAGGDAGSIRIRTLAGNITVGQILVQYLAGPGGDAVACGRDGQDAIVLTPAEPGQEARAAGGDAGGIGNPEKTELLGHIFASPVTNAAGIGLDVHGRRGGEARARGGDGGSGNILHPNGAAGGDMTAEGGRSARSWIFDNRDGSWPLVVSASGGSGSIIAGGNGGRGFGDCQFAATFGGAGGKGGDVSASAGARARAGGNPVGGVGRVTVREAANGGRGGDGTPPGAGGAAGENAIVTEGAVELVDPTFQPGPPGQPCAQEHALLEGAIFPLALFAEALAGPGPGQGDQSLVVTVDARGTLTVLRAHSPGGGPNRAFGTRTAAQALAGPTLSVVRTQEEFCPGATDLFFHRAANSQATVFTVLSLELQRGCRGSLGGPGNTPINFQRPIVSGVQAGGSHLVYSDFRGIAHIRNIDDDLLGRHDRPLTPGQRSCPWSSASRGPRVVLMVAREGAAGTSNEECNETRGLYKLEILGFNSSALTGSLRVGTMPREVVISPDTSTAYLADYAEKRIHVINVASMTVTRTIPAPGGPTSLALTSDGALLLAAYWDTNQVGVIDAATGEDLIRASSGGEQPVKVRLAPDGETVWVLNYGKEDVANAVVKVFRLVRP